MPLNRLTVIQTLIDRKGLTNYLEIGVFNGHVLFRVRSPFKVAVDPAFAFGPLRRIGKILVNPSNLATRYFAKTSDDFFAEDAPRIYARRRVDVALVDGMHEYEVALRDVENTLRYLSPRGVVVVHDCNPQTREAAMSFAEWQACGPTAEPWNGSVWKAIVHLRSRRDDVNVFVLDCDQGLGIVTRGEPDGVLAFSESEIRSLTYADLSAHREAWLNLKPPRYFSERFGIH